jgi:hypothetical protein
MALRHAAPSIGKVLTGVGGLLLAVELVESAARLTQIPLPHSLILIVTVIAVILSLKNFTRTLWLLALIVLGFLSGGVGGALIMLGALIALVAQHI